MTKLLNSFNNFTPKLVRKLVPSFSGMLRVKAGRPLVDWLLRAALLVKGSVTKPLVKVSVSYIRTLHRLCKSNGVPYVAKYLKACTTLLMQAISGDPHGSTQELGLAVARTRSGLPRIIPRLHRSKIREGDLFYIRFWLTLFSLYRVLDYTGSVKIKTIITGSKANISHSEIRDAMVSFVKDFRLPIIDTSPEAMVVKPFWINTTSPNSAKPASKDYLGPKTCSTSIFSILGSYLALANDPVTRKNLMEFGYAFGLSSNFITVISFSRFAKRYLPKYLVHPIKDLILLSQTYLGKLAYKVEPAGKIRVFAMADCFTQWAMRPLHDALFYRLGLLSQDATHDQSKTLTDFVNRLKQNKVKRVYSFDLTAATDRIPVSVQALVLDGLTRRNIGSVWAAALVERWYQLPSACYNHVDQRLISSLGLDYDQWKDSPFVKIDKYEATGELFVSAVRYATGQPMGALSSWAMLAMTHHVMVHIAAIRVGKAPFKDYLVLGDDLVIADKAVASSYLSLAKEWDIEINLSKSVLSTNGSLEFAKRFIYKYQDVSGLSFKEMAVAKYDLRGLLQLISRVSSFREIKVSQLLSYLGHGYKALSRMTTKYRSMSKAMARTLFLLSYPQERFSTLTSVSSWLLSPSWNKPGIVTMPDKAVDYLRSLVLRVSDQIIQSDLPRNYEEYDKLFKDIVNIDSVFNNCYKRGHEVNRLLRNQSSIDVGARVDSMIRSLKSTISLLKSFEAGGIDPVRDTLRPLLMTLYFDIIERWDTTVVEVKDTFDCDEDLDVDTYWDYLEKLEDIASLNSQNSDFMPTKDVITLNKSVILRRAAEIRTYVRSLANGPFL